MSSIPLPALATQPPAQQDPMGQAAKILQMKSLLGQQQIQQQEIQENQLNLKERQNMVKLAPNYVQKDDSGKVTGYDQDGYFNGLMQAGVRPQTVYGLKNQYSEMVKNTAQAGSAQIDLQDKKNDQAYQLLEGIRSVATQKDVDPQAVNSAYQDAIPKAQALGVDTSKFPAQYPGEGWLTQTEAGLGVHKQMLSDAKDVASTQAENAKTALDNANAFLAQNKADVMNAYKQNPQVLLSQVDAIAPAAKYGDLNLRTKAGIHNSLMTGDVEGAQNLLKQAGDEVGGIEKETNPAAQAAKLHLATAEKSAEQAIADGDPKAAAQLLVSGTVAPSQIISSRKPAFAQQAFTAAQQMQPGWSAQKADADFKVASSPQQVAFFGSAKSLTDPGGTLDQLAAAAKDIPAGQIPVFNTVADAVKASTGSGPIAKYASLTLGVADDYSKVMGGGQGSDTSRTQAMNLIAAKQSPEQRAASIEGIRGAVTSQAVSRIGSNPVLQKMYGGNLTPQKSQTQQVPGGQAQGLKEGQTGTGSDGNKYVVKGGVWVAQ